MGYENPRPDIGYSVYCYAYVRSNVAWLFILAFWLILRHVGHWSPDSSKLKAEGDCQTGEWARNQVRCLWHLANQSFVCFRFNLQPEGTTSVLPKLKNLSFFYTRAVGYVHQMMNMFEGKDLAPKVGSDPFAIV